MALSPKQHAARYRGIGGSDAAAALGLSPWKTRFQLWYEKTSPMTEPGQSPITEAGEWGTLLEDAVAARFSKETGLALQRVNATLVSPAHPFMLGNVDRAIVNPDVAKRVRWDAHFGRLTTDAILEVKTTDARNAWMWGDPGTDQIPQNYLVQAVHYLIVTGVDRVWIGVLIGGNRFQRYVVERDPELFEMVIEGEREFWTMVQNRTPPEVETLADVALRYRVDTGKEVEATPDIVGLIERLVQRRKQMSALASEAEADELAIKAFMGDNTALTVFGIPFVTWKKAADTKRVDLKLLRERYPDIAAEVERPLVGARKFIIRNTGDENDSK